MDAGLHDEKERGSRARVWAWVGALGVGVGVGVGRVDLDWIGLDWIGEGENGERGDLPPMKPLNPRNFVDRTARARGLVLRAVRSSRLSVLVNYGWLCPLI